MAVIRKLSVVTMFALLAFSGSRAIHAELAAANEQICRNLADESKEGDGECEKECDGECEKNCEKK